MTDYKKIMVAIDGSDMTDYVLAKAAKFAKAFDAHVDIIYVGDTASISFGNATLAPLGIDQGITDHLTQTGEELVGAAKNKMITSDVKDVDTHVLLGDPKRTIAKDFPEEHDIDLILIGATGMNALERTLLGSVTSYIVRNAEVDTVVVRQHGK